MPTFMIFKDGNKIEELVGADPNGLQVCPIWLSGNIAWSLIKPVGIAPEGVVLRING